MRPGCSRDVEAVGWRRAQWLLNGPSGFRSHVILPYPATSQLQPQDISFVFNPPLSPSLSTLIWVFSLQLISTLKMGAIPEADPDEPVETKPFKFVTGKSHRNNPPSSRPEHTPNSMLDKWTNC